MSIWSICLYRILIFTIVTDDRGHLRLPHWGTVGISYKPVLLKAHLKQLKRCFRLICKNANHISKCISLACSSVKCKNNSGAFLRSFKMLNQISTAKYFILLGIFCCFWCWITTIVMYILR